MVWASNFSDALKTSVWQIRASHSTKACTSCQAPFESLCQLVYVKYLFSLNLSCLLYNKHLDVQNVPAANWQHWPLVAASLHPFQQKNRSLDLLEPLAWAISFSNAKLVWKGFNCTKTKVSFQIFLHTKIHCSALNCISCMFD